jgi:hypothetical protein
VKHALVLLLLLCLAPMALAASAQDVTVLPRPPFPAPAQDVSPKGPRLELVSSRFVDPATSPVLPAPPASVPRVFRGAPLHVAVVRPPRLLGVYGGRYVVNLGRSPYAFDFARYLRPPNGAWLEEVRWAREDDRVLYVEHAHLPYADETRGRNAYVSAIDLDTSRLRWRSRALVANARTFVVAGDLIVSGYGFTAERDFLYLLDRRTGRVLDRLEVPSAPDVIKLRGNRLHVRTYDRQVVARIVAG